LTAWGRTQWAVTVGLTPLLLAMFQQVSLISPLANALAIPLVSLAVVPLTLAGVLLPGPYLLQMAHALMAACGDALQWFGTLPSAVWQQHAPPWWAVAVALPAIAWLLLPRGFPARWIGIPALLPLFAVTPALLPEGALRLTVLDVGQGLAIVINTRRHALLYDTGTLYGPQADSGNRVIVPYLRAAGIGRLDAMVVSHGDKDHAGGVASVLAAVPVDGVISSLPVDDAGAAGWPNRARCETGTRWNWDGVNFEWLHPGPVQYARERQRSNDRSCVLRVRAGGAALLLTADIEEKSERELLKAAADKLPASVLLVPHHGSRTSSSVEFVRAVGPRIVLVAAGYRNRFGHPKEDVLERYRALGSRIYRTDLDGALLLSVGSQGEIAVQRQRALRRRYWHAALENPDLPDENDEEEL
jgi:competence protein ComEC